MPGLCIVSIDAPQNPDNSVSSADPIGEGTGDPKIDVALDLVVTRTGSAWCGPASGTGNIAAWYDLTPTSLSVD